MAITIIQKARRKKIILISGIAILTFSLFGVFYFTFMKSGGKSSSDNISTVTSTLSQNLKKLEIKWDALNDERFQNLGDFPDVSSLEIEESGRENPFLPY